MSYLLWKYYLEDDVEKFEALLSNGSQSTHHASKGHGFGTTYGGGFAASAGSPGNGSSPRTNMKTRKVSGNTTSGAKGQISLSRADLSSRDIMGRTILHRTVSEVGRENSLRYVIALLDHPAIDICVQDRENGWTALHRALYFGNATVARVLIERDAPKGNGLTKIKDYEGNTAFDVYNATIARRTLEHRTHVVLEETSDEDEASVDDGDVLTASSLHDSLDGDEFFAFGSNKNLNLGFGDEDDRQHPERINLKRPDHLLYRFYKEQFPTSKEPSSVSDLPSLTKNRPIIIQDLCLSKLHSAVLTTDPEANLYMCGFGPGGRLGTCDELTRFNYECIEGGALAGKKIQTVALGQNHSLAVSDKGEIFAWGTNTWGQLGYTLPRPAMKDEEPINSTPRQIFGPLKREIIIGVAASAIHSVAYTTASLYTWGKNEGQLGLMDSDSRSLEMQPVPRKVAASLFSTAILMVSAINRATICLLANHSVCVFTNYGYNYVKFPLAEGFNNYHLNSPALTTRYEAENHICEITSGGDTIAAISSRGDLFTFNVSNKLDPGTVAASTTNPAKIKSALSQPQRIWSLRKGHWDGIKSVGVSENGSVIICTQAGAVWRRIKRAKIKDAFVSDTGDFRMKDFKFQRVSGLTSVVAVRSNVFGSYAAIRRDCDVTKTQILVEEQNLWKDLAPTLSLKGLKSPEPLTDSEDANSRFWTPAIPREGLDSMKSAVFLSPNLEEDVKQVVQRKAMWETGFDGEIFTTLSDCGIPIHSFIFAARSSVFRQALGESHQNDEFDSDFMKITKSDTGTLRVEFQGVDFITIFNLVLYMYQDEVVDVWHFTRHMPSLAFRFRQIRTELMKLAGRLAMQGLETAVRLMVEPERCLNVDMACAIDDATFFDQGDVIIELESDEILVHSVLLCERCPFFESLFRGRAGGRWLADRRELEPDLTRVDMKHIDLSTFKLVLRYLYADVGPELFDEVVSSDIDEFSEVVMNVLSVANELLLDRLAQICQHVIGRFVNSRNVCHILNALAPCAITEFKDAGLEYLCLQLECMLENHLLNDLDEDIVLELDDVVRANQLACLPFAKSGRAELLLHERHPSLAEEIDEDRQRVLRDMAFRNMLREEDSRLSSSYRARVGSLDDVLSSSPQDKSRGKPKQGRNTPFSPALRPKDSTADLMFDMEDDNPSALIDSTSSRQISAEHVADTSGDLTPLHMKRSMETNSKGKSAMPRQASFPSPRTGPTKYPSPTATGRPTVPVTLSAAKVYSPVQSAPWSASPVLSSAKLDMKDIMTQASMNRTSTLSLNLSAQRVSEEAMAKNTVSKLSQKERKKQQQQNIAQARDRSSLGDDKASPWQIPKAQQVKSLQAVFNEKPEDTLLKAPPSISDTPISHLPPSKRRTASPDTRFSGQQRSTTSPLTNKGGAAVSFTAGQHPRATSLSQTSNSPLMPYSKSYNSPPKAEPSLQLSLADIIGQQKLEQDIIKEAVAKRSLQDIQEEQAFQEWWDQESKRAQEEEAQRAQSRNGGAGTNSRGRKSKGHASTAAGKGRGDSSQTHGRGRGRGRGRSSTTGPNNESRT